MLIDGVEIGSGEGWRDVGTKASYDADNAHRFLLAYLAVFEGKGGDDVGGRIVQELEGAGKNSDDRVKLAIELERFTRSRKDSRRSARAIVCH